MGRAQRSFEAVGGAGRVHTQQAKRPPQLYGARLARLRPGDLRLEAGCQIEPIVDDALRYAAAAMSSAAALLPPFLVATWACS